jgi:hypothetical protein
MAVHVAAIVKDPASIDSETLAIAARFQEWLRGRLALGIGRVSQLRGFLVASDVPSKHVST